MRHLPKGTIMSEPPVRKPGQDPALWAAADNWCCCALLPVWWCNTGETLAGGRCEQNSARAYTLPSSGLPMPCKFATVRWRLSLQKPTTAEGQEWKNRAVPSGKQSRGCWKLMYCSKSPKGEGGRESAQCYRQNRVQACQKKHFFIPSVKAKGQCQRGFTQVLLGLQKGRTQTGNSRIGGAGALEVH